MNVYELEAKIGLDTSGFDKGVKNSKKSMNEYKSDVMSLAQTYKQQGMSMSDAMKKAYADIDKSQYETAENSKKASKDFLSNWNNAGNIMDSVSKRIGNGFSFVAKAGLAVASAGVAVISAGSAALFALGKASIDQYAEYEQLAGGVQKIFDEMDNSQIFRDAQNAWKDLNMSASDYLTTIVDVGANFASTMGDSKGYETARRGFMAISDYASGTGKNVNELAQKFTMITRAASSYQSIADQFSGILPATSKDFLEQAQAAEFLSNKYKELTQVPIAEYQEAVSLMLEKGVANLNLTGNTARETATTISGSVFAMKAAWYNLSTGFADGSQDINQLLDNFVFSVENVAKNITPKIKELIPRLVEGISYLAKELGPEAESLMQELLPSLISGTAKLVADLIVKLPGILSDFGTAFESALVASLEEAGMDEAAQTVEDAFQSVKDLWQWIVDNQDSVSTAIGVVGSALTGVFASTKVMTGVKALTSFFGMFGAGAGAGAGAAGAVGGVAAATGPIGAITAIGMALVGVLLYLQQTNDEFAKFASKIPPQVNGEVIPSLEEAQAQVDAQRVAWEWLSSAATGAVQNMTNEQQRQMDETVAMNNALETAWTNIKEYFSDLGKTISENWDASMKELEELEQAWNDMWTGLGESWNRFTEEMGTKFDNLVEEITTSDMWTSFTQGLSDMKEEASEIWDNVVTTVTEAVSNVKSALDFSWKLPDLKVPEVKVTGGVPPYGIGGQGSLPKFQVIWHAKAMNSPMILNGATIFGAMGDKLLGGGEAGREVVSGADTLMNMIRNAVREVVHGGIGVQIVQNIQTVPQTPVEFAAATQSYFEQARWFF